MGKRQTFLRANARFLAWCVVCAAGLAWLLLYKLSSLTVGLSPTELQAASAPVGWHGIYQQPLYLPLKLLRSVVFVMFPSHGALLTRLPNAVFGASAIVTFAWLMRLWHGARPALLASLLFATSAWVLHASRLASFDVLYLWATPTLLVVHRLFPKYYQRRLAWCGSLLIWGLMLYIPGFVWFIVLELYLQRQPLRDAWKHHHSGWQRSLYIMAGLTWLPLLLINCTRSGQLVQWLGWPAHLVGPSSLLKQFVAVPVHLFIRGPKYPEIWLGRTPILDISTLIMCLIGIYFYATRPTSGRSRLLGGYLALGALLVGLGGPVGLSVIIPLLYIAAATGIAYLLHDWLHVFPLNPLARGFGVTLVSLAVSLSCLYNLRAYFVAWPHNSATKTTFSHHL